MSSPRFPHYRQPPTVSESSSFKRPNVALVASSAPNVAFGALDAPNATLGRMGWDVGAGPARPANQPVTAPDPRARVTHAA
jgi:hypothetical protein